VAAAGRSLVGFVNARRCSLVRETPANQLSPNSINEEGSVASTSTKRPNPNVAQTDAKEARSTPSSLADQPVRLFLFLGSRNSFYLRQAHRQTALPQGFAAGPPVATACTTPAIQAHPASPWLWDKCADRCGRQQQTLPAGPPLVYQVPGVTVPRTHSPAFASPSGFSLGFRRL
jgi:hypothetical protein